MKTLSLTINCQVKSGKNHMQITRSGRHFPLKSWALWRDDVVKSLKSQNKEKMSFDRPCSIFVKYYRGDNRRRDVPGMMDAVCHCLERSGIVKDDSLLTDWTWIDCEIERNNPRAEISIMVKA